MYDFSKKMKTQTSSTLKIKRLRARRFNYWERAPTGGHQNMPRNDAKPLTNGRFIDPREYLENRG